MSLVEGDCHADFTKFSSDNFPQGKDLTREDYVIICGDVGILWDRELSNREKYWIKWLKNKPWTTLFILGNHCNYDRWAELPSEVWHGGLVQKLADNVIRLQNGIFDINGFKFLALNGNYSHDISDGILEVGDPRISQWQKDYTKMFRVNHISWWKEEVPDENIREFTLKTLKEHDFKVDYILTHGLPATDLMFLYNHTNPNEYEYWLENEIRSKVNYKYLFSGHYHMDKAASYKDICIYERILQIL